MTRQIWFTPAMTVAVIAVGAGLLCSPRMRAAGVRSLTPGTYGITITVADIPDSFPPEAVAILTGEWELEFSDDGSSVARKAGQAVVTGRYVANPARLIITDEDGPLACVDPGTATGVYALTVQDERVFASAIHDRCAGRNLVMTAHPWQRVR